MTKHQRNGISNEKWDIQWWFICVMKVSFFFILILPLMFEFRIKNENWMEMSWIRNRMQEDVFFLSDIMWSMWLSHSNSISQCKLHLLDIIINGRERRKNASKLYSRILRQCHAICVMFFFFLLLTIETELVFSSWVDDLPGKIAQILQK